MITYTSKYYLTLAKVIRDIVSYQRNIYAGLECYALNVAKVLKNL